MKNNLRVSSIHHIFCVLLGTLGLCVIEHIGIVLILEACGFFSRLDYFIVALLGSSKSRALYWVHTRILLGFPGSTRIFWAFWYFGIGLFPTYLIFPGT